MGGLGTQAIAADGANANLLVQRSATLLKLERCALNAAKPSRPPTELAVWRGWSHLTPAHALDSPLADALVWSAGVCQGRGPPEAASSVATPVRFTRCSPPTPQRRSELPSLRSLTTSLDARRPTEAYADAVKALTMEPGHPKALLRKGMAAFALEEFATARTAFAAGAAAEPSTAAFQTWLRKCEVRASAPREDACVKATPDTSSEGRRCVHLNWRFHTAVSVWAALSRLSLPAGRAVCFGFATSYRNATLHSLRLSLTLSSHTGGAHQVELDDEASDESDDAIPSIATPAAPPAAPVTAAPPAAPPPRFRHEWYQTQDKVTVSVFARGTPAADVQVLPPSMPRAHHAVSGEATETPQRSPPTCTLWSPKRRRGEGRAAAQTPCSSCHTPLHDANEPCG
jgi:hypothetical protein